MSLFETLTWYQVLALILTLAWFYSRLDDLIEAIIFRLRNGGKK